jgi:MoaA/NifB/PqqE/SkfB family radical SAM enzyme
VIDILTLQNILPASIKMALKPFYRTIYPNQLCIVLWITFRCNYKCSYCPVVTKFNFGSIYGKDSERSPEDWITALNKLPNANIYISGGEPFIYKGLPDFVNNQTKHKILGIVTNATVKTEVYDRINKKTHLNLSFHSEFTTQEKFLLKIQELKATKKYHLNVNIVATRENIPLIVKFKELLLDENVSLHIDPLIDADMQFQYTEEEMDILNSQWQRDRVKTLDRLDFDEYSPKICTAGKNYINLMPNGDVFRCASGFDYFHSPLRKQVLLSGPQAPYDPKHFYMGNIFDNEFALDTKPIFCGLPCPAACDRDMAKISFLKRGSAAGRDEETLGCTTKFN